MPEEIQSGTRTFPPPPASREGTFVFLSAILDKPVRTQAGVRVGTLVDVLADAAEPSYPKVTALRIRVRGEVLRAEWSEVVACEPNGSIVKSPESLQPLKLLGSEIPLAQDVLDRQIVDTDDAKVERVNDLHLLRARGDLRVAHVDVGFRGLVRRLGWERAVDALYRAMRPESPYLKRDQFVPWKHVRPLAAGTAKVRLDLARRALSEVHPSDLAEILEDLDRRERAVLFRDLPVESAATALEESEPELQRELLRLVEPARAADIVEEMQPDAAADLLAELPAEESAQILAEMDAPGEVEQLLTYDENSAGGMMNTAYLRLRPAMTAQAALDSVRVQAKEIQQVHDCFVVLRDRKLAGVLSLRDLLLAPPEAPVDNLMHQHPAPLDPEDSAKHVAEMAAKYNLFSLPVEKDGKLLGVVTVDDVLEKVLHG
ncbi:MAG TPA: CBS domain-containing protein [Myxococcales bacterium]|nr:CBS domain-containing protein [Myxococcales bacterium]